MRGRHDTLNDKVTNMEGRLCHCAEVPVSTGSSNGLEYESSNSYVIAPQAPCSQSTSAPAAPSENPSPIPVPAPPTPSSNVENVDPSGSVRPTAPRLVRRKVLRRGGPYSRTHRYPHVMVAAGRLEYSTDDGDSDGNLSRRRDSVDESGDDCSVSMAPDASLDLRSRSSKSPSEGQPGFNSW
jgi:hypothetical protein